MLFDFTIDPLLLAKEGRALLKEGDAELIINNKKYSCRGSIYLNLFNSSSITIDANFVSVSLEDQMSVLNSGQNIKFIWEGKEINGFSSKTNCGLMNGEVQLKWVTQSEDDLFPDDARGVAEIKFHIFNFLNAPFPIKAEHNGWRVTIKPDQDLKKIIEDLNFFGGFRVTHVGVLERIDQKPFRAKKANDILAILRLCLSFMSGKWVEPICCIGLNKNGVRIWEKFSSPREKWRTPLRWSTQFLVDEFSELFPKFADAYSKNDLWQESLAEIIYWYLNANNNERGVDAGLILAQSAFEKLSFQHVVIDKEMLSSDGFEKLAASDKIRILVADLKISLSSASSLKSLSIFCKKQKIDDTIHAITIIRNSLVHAKRKYPTGVIPYYDAWLLSLWLLEMSILASIGYRGKYRSRLSNNVNPEDVPWA